MRRGLVLLRAEPVRLLGGHRAPACMTSSADASEEAGGLRGQGSRQGNPLVADDIERRTVDQGPIGKGPSKQPSMPAVPGAPEEAAETPPNVLVADAGDVEGQQPSWTGATGSQASEDAEVTPCKDNEKLVIVREQVTTTPNPLNQPEKKVVVGVKEYVVPAESA